MGKIQPRQIELYRSLFNTRDDVFARYWISLDGKKSGYAPVYQINLKAKSLTDQVIQSHLEGNQIIGVYPLFPDNTTNFLAIDFDGNNWFELIKKVYGESIKNDLFCSIERSKSGNGGHAWFFFSEQISSFKARQFGKKLLSQVGVTNRQTFDRMFPSQDEHTNKGFGNLICLPLQGKLVLEEKTVFIDIDNKTIPDQWQYLQSVKKITIDQIDKYLDITAKLVVEGKQDTEAEEEPNVPTTQGQETQLTLGANIFIPNIYLPDKLYRYLKKQLNFPNPDFYTKERFGYSTWQTPRFIKTLEIIPEGIIIPLGFLTKTTEFCKKENIKVTVKDERSTSKKVTFPSKLKLRQDQQKVLKQLLEHDRVILEAKPGFGKTMVALALMKKRSQKTLIIVHTNTLLRQWQKRINDYFTFKKDELGIIGDNKWKLGKKITIASYMTLSRRGVEEIKNDFGLIIIDECHHVPANTFSTVVKQFSAKHVLGLTATTFRKDKLEKLMYLYINDQVITANNKGLDDIETDTPIIETQLITHKTQFQNNIREFQEISKLVVIDKGRNDLIADDIVKALSTGAKCLVLSERLDHCQIILDLVRQKAKNIQAAVATGIMTRKQREKITKRLSQDRFQLLIATGKLIGEGFDWPAVSHLFLAFPFSWKGKLIQYVGRIQRPCESKTIAIVHDYFDDKTPMLKHMYFRRLRTYRSLGLTKIESPIRKKVCENQLGLF